jgi:hypothetical protein
VLVAGAAPATGDPSADGEAEPGVDPLPALLDRLGRAWARRYPVTSFSAGAAVYTGGNPDSVLRRADEALYQAKAHGRSCAWILERGRSLESGRLLTLPGTPFRPTHPAQQTLDLTASGRPRRQG